jgi:hypothetical protein
VVARLLSRYSLRSRDVLRRSELAGGRHAPARRQDVARSSSQARPVSSEAASRSSHSVSSLAAAGSLFAALQRSARTMAASSGMRSSPCSLRSRSDHAYVPALERFVPRRSRTRWAQHSATTSNLHRPYLKFPPSGGIIVSASREGAGWPGEQTAAARASRRKPSP